MGQKIDNTVDMFANYSKMSEREAQAFTLRKIMGVRRNDAAERMGNLSVNTVDSLVQSAKQKVELPNIAGINRQPPRNTGYSEQEAVEARFENGAVLRYVRMNDGSVHEQVMAYDDPHSIYDSYEIDTSETASDCIEEYLMVGLETYTAASGANGFKELAKTWDTLFEALTGQSANAMNGGIKQ